jgi:hypothetical protein
MTILMTRSPRIQAGITRGSKENCLFALVLAASLPKPKQKTIAA